MPKSSAIPEFRRIVWASLGVHVLAILVLLGVAKWQHHDARHRNAIIVHLARKGEMRPEHLLPRINPETVPVPDIPTAPKPTTPVAPPVPTPAPPQPAKPDPAGKQPSVKDRLAAVSRVSGALSRLEKATQEKVEGDPGGVDSGTTSDVQGSLYRSRFGAEVHACLQAHYQFEGVDPTLAQGRGLEAEVSIRVAADGRFEKYDVHVARKHAAFERAVRHAIDACGKVSPPPAVIRQEMKREGLLLLFKP